MIIQMHNKSNVSMLILKKQIKSSSHTESRELFCSLKRVVPARHGSLADVRRGWSPGCVRWPAAVSLGVTPYSCTWADPAGWSMCALQGNTALLHRWAGSLTPGSSFPWWGSGRCPSGTLEKNDRKMRQSTYIRFWRTAGMFHLVTH